MDTYQFSNVCSDKLTGLLGNDAFKKTREYGKSFFFFTKSSKPLFVIPRKKRL